MGERGAKNEAGHRRRHRGHGRHRARAVAAGALGFSTSRTMVHRALDGEPVPGTFAAEDELFGIGRALGELGRRRVRTRPGGSAGEDVIVAREGGRLDGPAVGRDRAAGDLRHAPGRRRHPISGSSCSTCARRPRPKAPRCARRCRPAPSACCRATRPPQHPRRRAGLHRAEGRGARLRGARRAPFRSRGQSVHRRRRPRRRDPQSASTTPIR